MLFRLNAEMESSFSGNFSKAQQSISGIEKEIMSLQKTQADISSYTKQQQSVEATTNKLSVLQKQYDNIQKEIDETGKFSSGLQNKLLQKQQQIDRTTASLGKQTEALNSMGTALEHAGVDTSKLSDESKRLQGEIDNLKGAQMDAADGSESFGDKAVAAFSTIKSTLVALGITKVLKEIAEGLMECANASMEFETAMASVQRTVGVSGEELDALGDAFKQMSMEMPITTTELGKIATTAGQLGIASDKVEEFTRIMAELSTTTDLTADDAATYLAQFANITGTTDYERLGSAVAALGDATATTASKVVQMSQGMAASASLAGMSETDILAISAAVGSLGIEAQAGSTAMSTLISTLYKATETEEGLEDFAKVADMSAEEFKEAWGNDAVGTMNAFITGLNDTERNGKSAIVILDELGITNVRQTKAILGLASAGDLLSGTIEQANAAWEENTALQEKAGVMYDTTESQLTMMKNSWNNLKIAIGDKFTPILKDAYSWLSDTFVSLTNIVDELDNGVPSVHELTEEVRKMNDALEDGKKALSDELASTEASKRMAELYADRLDELGEANVENTEHSDAYWAVLKNLVNTIPELNDVINLETGYIEGGTEAIRRNTEAWEENQRVKAYQAYADEATAAVAGAEYQIEYQKVLKTMADEEALAWQKQADEVAARMKEIWATAEEEGKIGRRHGEKVIRDSELATEYNSLQSELYRLNSEVITAQKESENYDKAIAEATKTYEEAQKAAEAASTAVENLTREMEQLTTVPQRGAVRTDQPYASGTLSATAGVHLVGEHGPELVGFGGGERVLNAAMTSRLLGGVTLSVNFNIEGNVGSGAMEALSEYGNEFASKVLDVLEEAGIDSRRRAYA